MKPKKGFDNQSGNWVLGDVEHNIRELYRLAPRAKEILDAEVADIVRQAQLPDDALVTVRLKGSTDDPGVFDYTRIREKAKGKYQKKHPSSNGMALILDIVRMSILCDTVTHSNQCSLRTECTS